MNEINFLLKMIPDFSNLSVRNPRKTRPKCLYLGNIRNSKDITINYEPPKSYSDPKENFLNDEQMNKLISIRMSVRNSNIKSYKPLPSLNNPTRENWEKYLKIYNDEQCRAFGIKDFDRLKKLEEWFALIIEPCPKIESLKRSEKLKEINEWKEREKWKITYKTTYYCDPKVEEECKLRDSVIEQIKEKHSKIRDLK